MSKKCFNLILLVGVLAVSAQANLLTNGDFETGDLTGWWTWTADPGNQSVSIDADFKYEGDYSVELSSASSAWQATLGQACDLGENEGWAVSFVYNAMTPSDWGSAGLAVDYKDADWNYLNYEWIELFNEGPAPNPGEWISVSNNYTTPPGTAHIELQFKVANWTTVNFDNITVIPEPATIALMALGGIALLRKRRK